MDYIKEQLKHTLDNTKFNLDGEFYKGKVRDNYFKKYYTWRPPIYGF